MNYVTKSGGSGDIFLDALESADSPGSLVIHRAEQGFIIMNLYPYNTGHMLVVPNQKTANLNDLTSGTRAELFELVNLAVESARIALRCDGFNIGVNLGQVAGAGVADHLHIHVVPRWTGDANFMPITAQTKALPEQIPATAAKLRAEIETTIARSDGIQHLTAGAFAVTEDGSKVVVRRSASGELVLPKGHIEAGESAGDAARRELGEETGYLGRPVAWAGSDRFMLNGESFSAVYLIMSAVSGPAAHAHLDSDTVLVPIDEVASALSLPSLQTIARHAYATLQREESTTS